MPVDPEDVNYPYDLKLTNGSTTVEMVLCDNRGDRSILGSLKHNTMVGNTLKTYSGQQKYSDVEPPWTPVAQSDWSGGRGGLDFDKDASKYNDGRMIDTTKAGQIIPAGQYIYMKGHKNANMRWDYASRTENRSLVTDENYYAVKFTPTADYTGIISVSFVAKTINTIDVSIYTDDGGAPDALVAEATTTVKGDSVNVYEEYKLAIGLDAATLTSGTAYWVIFYSLKAVLLANYLPTGACSKSADGASWTSIPAGFIPYYQIACADADFKSIFCEYKGALFMAVRYANTGTYSKLFVNGSFGVADASGASTLVDATKTWVVNEWTGCQLKIIAGTGFDQEQNWRYIASNTADTLTVDYPWDVVPDITTVYCIKRANNWTEVTGFDTNFNAVITDMLAVNGALYIACGDGHAIVRMVAYNNAGTWTVSWSSVSGSAAETGQYTHLKYGTDHAFVSGIWGAKSGLPSTVAFAPAQDWSTGSGSALTFETAINVGNLYERITGIDMYISPSDGMACLHMFKEGSNWYMYRGDTVDLPTQYFLNEMGATKDSRNGLAHYVHGLYLYTSWHASLLRYYNGSLDRVGPDKADDPLPYDRSGNISAIAGTAGMVFIAVDAGADGYSCVMANNGSGWCEFYRAPNTGDRIKSLYMESIDGNMPDRLLFSCGSNVLWLPISEDPHNHTNGTYDYYMFNYQGEIITSYFYVGLNEVEKFFNSITALMYKRTYWYGGGTYNYPGVAFVYYRTEDDRSWTYIGICVFK